MTNTEPSLTSIVRVVPDVEAVTIFSVIAASNLGTPFASVVTTFDASVVPRVVISK